MEVLQKKDKPAKKEPEPVEEEEDLKPLKGDESLTQEQSSSDSKSFFEQIWEKNHPEDVKKLKMQKEQVEIQKKAEELKK